MGSRLAIPGDSGLFRGNVRFEKFAHRSSSHHFRVRDLTSWSVTALPFRFLLRVRELHEFQRRRQLFELDSVALAMAIDLPELGASSPRRHFRWPSSNLSPDISFETTGTNFLGMGDLSLPRSPVGQLRSSANGIILVVGS